MKTEIKKQKICKNCQYYRTLINQATGFDSWCSNIESYFFQCEISTLDTCAKFTWKATLKSRLTSFVNAILSKINQFLRS
jgi:hypothetical protein